MIRGNAPDSLIAKADMHSRLLVDKSSIELANRIPKSLSGEMARSLNYRQTKRPRNWKRTWPSGIPISPANRTLASQYLSSLRTYSARLLAAPLNTCPSSDSSLVTMDLVASASFALSQLGRVFLCLC